MNKTSLWLIILIVAVVLVGGFFLLNRPSPFVSEEADVDSFADDGLKDDSADIILEEDRAIIEDNPEPLLATVAPLATPPASTPSPASPNATNLKTFNVSGRSFAFSPAEIRVQQGDTVRINFTSTEGFHNFVIDEFKVATAQVNTGGSASVEFVAAQAGTFEYYCGVGNHRQLGMVGQLIVE